MGETVANSKKLKWIAHSALAGVLLASGLSGAAIAQEAGRSIQLNMPAQPLSEALRAFARSSGEQIVFSEELVDGKQAPALSGAYTSDAALGQLLHGSGLVARRTARGAIMILAENDPRAQQSGSIDEGASSTQHAEAQAPSTENSGATSEILVQGHQTQNADIRRTRDDIQPYVVFDAQQIANSGAVNLEEFLARHLPQNAQNNTAAQLAGTGTGPNLIVGSINLRGLGANQTLVLVDGRRLPDVWAAGAFKQPDINAIPPASIERIEILPATASGIYGGGATGGVINIVLKRDYSGLDLTASYGNTFDTDASNSNITLSGGHSFNNGQTHVTFSVSHSSGSQLLASDRDFDKRRADILLRTSPTSYFPYGSSVCSTVDSYVGSNSCDGGPLVLDNGTPLNSNRTFVPRGYAGALATGDGGAAFLANAGLVDTSYDPIPLYTGSTTDALSLNVRHTFTSWLEGYFNISRDATKSSWEQAQLAQIILPAASPDNPFQQNVLVNVPLPGVDLINSFGVTTWSALGGAIIRLPHEWSAALEYQWTKTVSNNYFVQPFEMSATALSTLSPVALSDMRSLSITDASVFDLLQGSQPSGNRLATYSARFSGPLFSAPGGDVTMTALLEHRDQRTDGAVFGENLFGPTYEWVPAATEQVMSEYAEVRVPVVSNANALPFVQALDLTLAARHDAYDFDYPGFQILVPGPDGPFPPTTNATSSLSSTDYTFGLRYAPVRDVTFRASYGTGFLPPAMVQFAVNTPRPYPAYYYNLTDPRRGGSLVTGDSSGNISFGTYASRGVQPEDSRSFSYGLIFTPGFLSGLRISVDFVETHKTNEIVGYISPQTLVDLEANFPDRIVRGPNLSTDPTGWAGPIIGIDSGAINAAKSDIRSIDFQIDYSHHTERFGDWHFYVLGSEQTRLQRTLFPGATSQNYIGLQDGPRKWQGSFGMDWTQGPWTLAWDAQYTDAFSPCGSYFIGTPQCAVLTGYQGRNHLSAQLYNDVNVRYVFAQSDHAWGRMLDGAEINLGIQNVFNEEPPVYGIPNVNYTATGDPRLRRFTLTLREHF
jgi:outer membrane receptor protein involved in Fe transport